MEEAKFLIRRIGLPAICLIQVLVCFGCAMLRTPQPSAREERLDDISRYKGYQPLDPSSVRVEGLGCKDIKTESDRNKVLVRALPNEAVRLVIGQLDASGNISFGTFTGRTKIGSYVVVLDYIKYQSRSLPIWVIEHEPLPNLILMDKIEELENSLKSGHDADKEKQLAKDKAQLRIQRDEYFNDKDNPPWKRSYDLGIRKEGGNPPSSKSIPYNIPVYVGIGVRMTASVTVNDISVDLGSLYGLGVGAQSKKLQGTLLIQTLGLSGEIISPHIPLPSEINITTIQNAIQALATMKSKLYDDKVYVEPVVLAIDDYVGRKETKERIVTLLRENEGEYLKLSVDPTIK